MDGSSPAQKPNQLSPACCWLHSGMSQRLMKEFREASQSKDKDIKLTVQDNLYKWTAYLQGPEGTPFEGGCFEVGLSALSAPAPKISFAWSMRVGTPCLVRSGCSWLPRG